VEEILLTDQVVDWDIKIIFQSFRGRLTHIKHLVSVIRMVVIHLLIVGLKMHQELLFAKGKKVLVAKVTQEGVT
tara:strand:- start:231 stop:452 length:222 start_codon:yes stop_codon:yes gene_type:complete